MSVKREPDSPFRTIIPPKECVKLPPGRQLLDFSGQITVLWQPEEGTDEAYKMLIKEGKHES